MDTKKLKITGEIPIFRIKPDLEENIFDIVEIQLLKQGIKNKSTA